MFNAQYLMNLRQKISPAVETAGLTINGYD